MAVEELSIQSIPSDNRERVIDASGIYIPTDDSLSQRQVVDEYNLIFSTTELPYLNVGTPFTLEGLYKKLVESQRFRDRLKNRVDYSNAWFTKSITIKTLLVLGNIGNEDCVIPPHQPNHHIYIHSHDTFRAQVSLTSSAEYMRGPESDRDMKNLLEPKGLKFLDFSSTKNKEMHPGTYPIIGQAVDSGNQAFSFQLNTIFSNPPDGRSRESFSLKISFLLLSPEHQTLLDQWINIGTDGQKWLDVDKIS